VIHVEIALFHRIAHEITDRSLAFYELLVMAHILDGGLKVRTI